jgi:hypothetical protein
MGLANQDLSVNPPGSYNAQGVWVPVVYSRTYTAPDGVTQVTMQPDYLFLVNGIDDGQSQVALALGVPNTPNGYIDDGYDGIDNDGNGLVDDPPEWEIETWTGPSVNGVPYVIARRPVPGNPTASLLLTVPVSIGASQLIPGLLSGTYDVMIRPDGTVDPSSQYSSPSSIGLAQHASVFAFVDPDGHETDLTMSKTGLIQSQVIK